MANETLRLTLQPRNIKGKEVQKLRKQGVLPIGICGKGIEPFAAQVDEREFMRVINQAGYSGLIELTMPGKRKQSAFLQELQRNPLNGQVLHADLKVVDINKPVEIDVHVVVHGENTLVERGDAVVNLMHSTLRVRALPTEIPHQIDVDVASLTEVGQHITVSDLKIDDHVEVLDDAETVILALGYPTRAVEEEETTEAAEGEGEGETDAEASDEE